MTEQAMTTTTNSNHNELVVLDQMTRRLQLMVQNGNKLKPDEAQALAQYAISTDLNPFLGECYYLPGIGPGPGIAGWRKKADEQLEYEARRAAEPLARFWCDYVEPTEDEVGKLTPEDNGIKAILHDTLTKNAWEKRTLSHYNIDLVKNGIKDNAWETAQALAGPEPTWSAVGIVRKDENFGRDKMPRYERACKRAAEKAAIRKRFPRVHLPEPTGFDAADIVDSTFIEQEKVQRTDPDVRRDEAEIMKDLGYDQFEQPPVKNNAVLETNTQTDATLAEVLVSEKISENTFAANALIHKLSLDKLDRDEALKRGHGYRGWRDMGADSNQAAANIAKGEYPK